MESVFPEEEHGMNETVKICFGLIGGLALFLYGMNTMSDALQKTAGERMKKILSFLTKNPIMGALAGALVTAVLQSSSATTVMAIGFVSAGLMTLPQAISVIFGANIGTTMTAQLLAFKLSDYIYPIIFIGFMLQFVGKTEKLKNIGMVIFSFGLLFEGIEIMGHVMKPLAGSSVFVDLMAEVSSTPVLGVLLGGVMTLVVQSSSATIAVLQNFAAQPAADGVSSVIGLTGAIPILLGDNIGTTITAILASIGQTKNAQRTAIAHSIFNISGSLVCLCIIPLFAQFVQYISLHSSCSTFRRAAVRSISFPVRSPMHTRLSMSYVRWHGCHSSLSWSRSSKPSSAGKTRISRPPMSRNIWITICSISRPLPCTLSLWSLSAWSDWLTGR